MSCSYESAQKIIQETGDKRDPVSQMLLMTRAAKITSWKHMYAAQVRSSAEREEKWIHCACSYYTMPKGKINFFN